MSSADRFLAQFAVSPEDPLAPAQDPLATFLDRFSGPKMESYWFYDGTSELRFDKESWTYYLVGELGNLIAQYGVTSVIKIIDKSAMLVPWASKMCMEKMLRIIPTNLLMTDEHDPNPMIVVPSMALSEFAKFALEAKAAHKEKLETAGDIGHQAHACLEASIKYALANDPDRMVRILVEQPADPRAVSCASAAFNWMQAHRVRWQHTEKKIYSREYGYAGTMDGLATYDSCADKACCAEQFSDKLFIADWKTSNALRLEYILQISAYRNAYEEEHGTCVEQGVVLRLGKEDGEFESLQVNAEDFSAGFSGFLGCLNLLKAVEHVEDLWKAKKDYRKAAQKEAKSLAKEQAKAAEKAAKAAAKAEKKATKEAEKATKKKKPCAAVQDTVVSKIEGIVYE